MTDLRMVELMDQYEMWQARIDDYGWLDKHTREEHWEPLLSEIAEYVHVRGYGR